MPLELICLPSAVIVIIKTYVLTQGHAHGNVGVLDHLCELLERDLAVMVQVGFHDSLVYDLGRSSAFIRRQSIHLSYLLQLLILQVASDHHLQHNKQLSVADVAITVDVVNLECEP